MLSPESHSPQSQKLMQKEVFPAITKMKAYFSQINPFLKKIFNQLNLLLKPDFFMMIKGLEN